MSDSDDPDDPIGTLVTSFDTPVTFNKNITVVGDDGSLENVFNSPVIISVQDKNLKAGVLNSLVIRSNVSSTDPVTGLEQDEQLSRINLSLIHI